MSEQVKPQLVWLPDGFGAGEHVHVYRATDYDALHAEAEALRAENGRLRPLAEDREQQYNMKVKARQQRDAIRTELEAARGLLRDIAPFLAAPYGRDDLHHRLDAFLAAAPAPEVPAEPPILQDEAFADEFAKWWESDGQYVRSGGGDYERTFAFEVWRYLMPKVRAAQAEQGERKEAVAWKVVGVHAKHRHPHVVVEHTIKIAEGQAAHWRNRGCEVEVIPLYTTPQPGPDVRGLVEALEQIQRWDGFPPTGKFWEGSGAPMSYSACYGSNGERDFMRNVAANALSANRQTQQGDSHDT